MIRWIRPKHGLRPPKRYAREPPLPYSVGTTTREGLMPKLLEEVHSAICARQMSPRTEETYAGWIKRFVRYHGLRHPLEMAEPEVQAFLTHLAHPTRIWTREMGDTRSETWVTEQRPDRASSAARSTSQTCWWQ